MQIISVTESLPDQPIFNIRHFILRKNKKKNIKLQNKAKMYFLNLAAENGAQVSEYENLINLGVYTQKDGYMITYTCIHIKKKDK